MIPYYILAIEDESDREFMSSLYLQYEKLMYSTILKVTQDNWLVDDIFQSTFEKLIDRIPLLKTFDRDRLVNYLIVACRNTAYNVCQSQARHLAEDIDDYIGVASSIRGAASVEDCVILQNQLDCLQKIWTQLDTRSRYILESKYILEKSDAEIAADLKIKPGSVRMALARARKHAIILVNNKIHTN